MTFALLFFGCACAALGWQAALLWHERHDPLPRRTPGATIANNPPDDLSALADAVAEPDHNQATDEREQATEDRAVRDRFDAIIRDGLADLAATDYADLYPPEDRT